MATASLSLLEKYSNLHRSIDQARDDTATVQLQIRETHQQLEHLLEDRQRTLTETKTAHEERERLTTETELALTVVVEQQDYYALRVSTNYEQAKSQLESANARANEYRQTFLGRSRDFRSACKRLCVRVHPAMLLEAYALVKRRQELQACFQQQRQQESSDEENDLEMMQAEEQVRVQETGHLQTQRAKEKLVAKKKALLEKKEKQMSQREQLQSQLDRIQQDVRDAKTQIVDLEQETSESRATACNFQNELRRRRERAAAVAASKPSASTTTQTTQRPPMRNPYLKKKATANAPAASSSGTTKAKQNTGPPSGAGASARREGHSITARQWTTPRPSSSTQQYPHRVGRVRASRGFGSTLRIVSDQPVNNHELEEPALGNIIGHEVQPPNGCNQSKKKLSSTTRVIQDEEDENEENDELLSFVAFGK